ncbi:ABC-type multidrug transport system, permease component [Pilibacter termitis]|uniref:ABC-type multidrug transport system, permease component n=1 Tax=Pilibacter termitis TaxID=263852 RepID=A0A1T4QE32_9ENTE|nr:ABC transporter permease [Pilibacter termitis]SKA01954.1 ABC-type multidrug transport system, permease component [Pilibacter termitis]
MSNLLTLTNRNLKIYTKNKGRLIFSFFSPALVLVLYNVFLYGVIERSFTKNFQGINASKEEISTAILLWIVSGAIYLATLSTATSAIQGYTEDRLNRAFDDFYITPISRFELALSHILSTFVITFVITTTLYLASILATFGRIPFSPMILVGILVESLFAAAFLAFLAVCFANSEGSVTALSALMNSLGGFLAGVYITFDTLGNVFASSLKLLPFAQGATLFREYFMQEKMNDLIEKFPPTVQSDVREKVFEGFGISLTTFDKTLSSTSVLLLALAWSVFLLAITVKMIARKRNGGEM